MSHYLVSSFLFPQYPKFILECQNLHRPLSAILWSHLLLLLFSHYVVSDYLWPHGLQHARLPCPSLSPGVCSNSCPWSQWCHPTISSFHPLLILPSIFLSIRLFISDGQSIGPSASASVLPINSGLISFRIDWFDLLDVQGTLKSLL